MYYGNVYNLSNNFTVRLENDCFLANVWGKMIIVLLLARFFCKNLAGGIATGEEHSFIFFKSRKICRRNIE